MARFTTTHRLRFNDTDRLGHVNNAVFAVMLEQGRSELAVAAGLPIAGNGQALVIVRLELDFVREMGWPGDVQVETWVERLGERSIRLRQELIHAGEVCGRALTILVVLDRATGRAAPLAPDWRIAMAEWLEAD